MADEECEVFYCNVPGTYFYGYTGVCPSCQEEWALVETDDIPSDAEIED